MWQIAVGDNSETNHQHCFYETSVTLGILTASPPSGSRLTFVYLKDGSQQYGQPLSSRHVGLRMCRSHLVFFPLPATEPIWTRGINTLTPRSGKLWRRPTSRRWLVAGTALAQIMRHSLLAPPHPTPRCPHICVSPPAGEPAASLAAVGGDGERRELLRGGTAATLRGPSPAAQQQGANCGNALVRLVDGKRSVTPVTATLVRHFPAFNNEETKTLQSLRN